MLSSVLSLHQKEGCIVVDDVNDAKQKQKCSQKQSQSIFYDD